MTTLNELAERCEKATGPDRELALSILCAVDPEHWTMGCNPSARDPTASLDAAISLVPEGWTYQAYQGPSGQPHKWTLRTIADGDAYYTEREGKAATPALALCAAALRARGASHELR
jgi:hypothetical protein